MRAAKVKRRKRKGGGDQGGKATAPRREKLHPHQRGDASRGVRAEGEGAGTLEFGGGKIGTTISMVLKARGAPDSAQRFIKINAPSKESDAAKFLRGQGGRRVGTHRRSQNKKKKRGGPWSFGKLAGARGRVRWPGAKKRPTSPDQQKRKLRQREKKKKENEKEGQRKCTIFLHATHKGGAKGDKAHGQKHGKKPKSEMEHARLHEK